MNNEMKNKNRSARRAYKKGILLCMAMMTAMSMTACSGGAAKKAASNNKPKVESVQPAAKKDNKQAVKEDDAKNKERAAILNEKPLDKQKEEQKNV